MKHDAEEAERLGSPIRGILGKSVLQPCLDLVDGVPVDYMHSVVEGVAKWMLHMGKLQKSQQALLHRKGNKRN